MRPRFVSLLGLGLAAAAAVGLGWLFGLPELTALAVALWSAAAISYLLVALAAPPPAVNARTEPASVVRGEAADLVLRFTNPATRRSSPATFTGTLGSAGARRVAVGPMEPGASSEVRLRLQTPRREVMSFGPLEVLVRGPLHLWRRTTQCDLTATLPVRPAAHDVGGPLGRGGLRPGAAEHSAPLHGTLEADLDLVGLRPYVPGDDIRRVHWRTSARRGEPHVVQVEPHATHAPVVVVLDTRASACGPERFEYLVEAAASAATAADALRRPLHLATALGLVGSGTRHGPLAGAAPVGLERLLDILAGIAQQPDGDIRAVLDSLHDGSATLVVCTAAPLPRPRRLADTPTILVIDWDGSGPIVAAAPGSTAVDAAPGSTAVDAAPGSTAVDAAPGSTAVAEERR